MTYNLSTGDEAVMTFDYYPGYERCPRISGDLVVCMNDDYQLNLSWLKGQLPVSIQSGEVYMNYRWWGDIDGNVVCWMSLDYNLCWRELWCDMDRRPYGVRLDGSSCYRGSTYFAQGADVSSCGVGDAADVWHSIHVDEKGWWNFELQTDMTNPITSVFNHAGQEVSCTSDTSFICYSMRTVITRFVWPAKTAAWVAMLCVPAILTACVQLVMLMVIVWSIWSISR